MLAANKVGIVKKCLTKTTEFTCYAHACLMHYLKKKHSKSAHSGFKALVIDIVQNLGMV